MMHRLTFLLPLLVACSPPTAPAGLDAIVNGHLQVVDLQSWEAQHGRIPKGAVVFALTGWAVFESR